MWKSRKIVSLALALPLSIALAACSGTGAPAPATQDASSSAAAMTGKLTVWCWDPAFNIYAMNEAAKIYAKDHPGVTVDVVETPWDDLQTKLTTLAQSKETTQLPDIFLMQNNAFQKNVINYPDLFQDFSKSGVNFSEFPAGVTGYSTVDGINYGLPFDSGTAMTALRTDLIKEAGFTVADFTDITWTDFIAKGKEVKAKTKKPMLTGQAGSADLILMMLQSAGASLFDDKGQPTISGNEALLKAISIYKELVKSGVLVEVNSWDEYIASIVNGNVAGTINGVWISGSIQTAKDQSGKWGITNLPKMDDLAGATNYSANGGSSWAISANANYDLAADFLKSTFAGSTEFYDTILPSSGAVANWLPAGKSSVYAEPLPFFGDDAIYAKVIGFSSQVPKNNTGAYYYEGRDAVSAAITKIVNGTDPAAALDEAQKATEFAMKWRCGRGGGGGGPPPPHPENRRWEAPVSLPPTPALAEGPPASAPSLRAAAASKEEKPRRRFRVEQRRNLTGWMFLIPAAVLILWMNFWPMAQAFILSLQTGRGTRLNFAEPLWYNYQRLFSDEIFKLTVQNTLIYLVIQVPIMLILALILANLLNDKNLRFKGMWRTAIFLPCAVSLVSYSLVFRTMFANDGLINDLLMTMHLVDSPVNWLGQTGTARMVLVLGLIWRWTGYNMVFYLAAMQNLDYSTLEAAKIDGAGSFKTFWYVTIPQLKPMILLTAILSTNGTIQLFDESWNLTQGGPAYTSMTMSHYLFELSFQKNPNFGYAAALSYAILIMVAVLAAIQMKVGDKRD